MPASFGVVNGDSVPLRIVPSMTRRCAPLAGMTAPEYLQPYRQSIRGRCPYGETARRYWTPEHYSMARRTSARFMRLSPLSDDSMDNLWLPLMYPALLLILGLALALRT